MKFSQFLVTAVLVTGIAAAKETTTQIKVSGMTCGACAVSVKAALTRTKGVKSANVNTARGLAIVVYDDSQVSEQQLLDEINRTGFKAEPSKEKR